MKPLRRLAFGLSVAALLALGACGRSGEGVRFKATDITGSDYGRALDLPDASGKVRSLSEFQGKVVVVFFGFTQCPDVCPTTLLTMTEVMKRLGADAQRMQVIFVTLDPARDTPAVLGKYVTAFDPGFIALAGTPEQTQAAAREFKVFYQKVPGKVDGAYSIDHTAASFVFDPRGRLRLYVRHQQTPDEIAEDVKRLLAGA